MKARKVKRQTMEMISQHVDVEDLFVTQTVEQSDQSLDEIIERRYPLLFSGGGDGTAMRVMEQIRNKVERHNKNGGNYKVPRFGLLKLGTGNGWAGLLEVPPRAEPIWAIRRVRKTDELKFATFNMIESEGRLFHFGGFGVDAQILNDYIDLKNRYTRGFMWKIANSLAGYLMAILFKTLPGIMMRGFSIDAKIVNESDEPVYRASNSEGVVETPIKKGEVIYEGPTRIAGFATTCNYGFDLQMYPFAIKKPGYMQLRICASKISTILRNVVPIWTGKWEHPLLQDFLVKDVSVQIKGDAPFQLGGDPEGYRNAGRFRVSDFTVEVLDFRN